MRFTLPRLSALAFIVAALVFILLYTGGHRKPAPNVRDFSKTNTVTILLGDVATEHGDGLQHMHFEKDGLTTATEVEGVRCRCLGLESNDVGYLYFVIDPTFKKRTLKNAVIQVEYLDTSRGALGIEYDATASKKALTGAYTGTPQTVDLAGSRTWHTTRFPVQNASFRNAQNSGSDFRLWLKPPQICVRRVTVTRQ